MWPTQVNDADVVHWKKLDFADYIFYMSLWYFNTKIIHWIMDLSASIPESWENQNCFLVISQVQVLSPKTLCNK